MIEGWLEVRHPADYPVGPTPSASNICGLIDETASLEALESLSAHATGNSTYISLTSPTLKYEQSGC
jgi:hypothetical protein